MARPFKVIDLFAGAGGLTLGFRRAGFAPVLAVEREKDFAASYAANFDDHVIVDDVASIVNRGGIDIPADIVIGGPPSLGYSNLTGNQAQDPRRVMWRFFMHVVEQTKCKVFLIENVPNLLKSPEGAGIVNLAHKLGYFTVFGQLHANSA